MAILKFKDNNGNWQTVISSVGPTWNTLEGKPTEFNPLPHVHPEYAVSMAISTLPASATITLNSTSARTYQTCNTNRTSITLTGGEENPGYEHYILFQNTGSSDCVITKASNMLGPETITVPAGAYLELSYIYNGSKVIITSSGKLN